jgi:hypothetical protein
MAVVGVSAPTTAVYCGWDMGGEPIGEPTESYAALFRLRSSRNTNRDGALAVTYSLKPLLCSAF